MIAHAEASPRSSIIPIGMRQPRQQSLQIKISLSLFETLSPTLKQREQQRFIDLFFDPVFA